LTRFGEEPQHRQAHQEPIGWRTIQGAGGDQQGLLLPLRQGRAVLGQGRGETLQPGERDGGLGLETDQ
jgi:hypothetical protein